MRVKHIKFKVNKPGEVLLFNGHDPLRKPDTLQELNWSLGLGPCGRWVESLEVDITLAVVTIKQTSYERDYSLAEKAAIARMEPAQHKGLWVLMCPELEELRRTKEIKTFIYKLEDVRGRIEAIEQGQY